VRTRGTQRDRARTVRVITGRVTKVCDTSGSMWQPRTRFALVLCLGALACGTKPGEQTGAPPVRAEAAAPVQDIGPEGGTVTEGGVVVTIPPGALEERVSIRVEPSTIVPAGFIVDGGVLRFSPSGLKFAVPITVSFPAGTPEGHVFWTVDGDETKFERLETAFADGRAIAHPTHFSEGFVGRAEDEEPPPDPPLTDGGVDASSDASGPTGITCITKRRYIVTCDNRCTCDQDTTVEEDVAFWLTSPHDVFDPEGAITSSSPGIAAYYNLGEDGAGFPYFIATDESRTLYVAYNPSTQYVLRSGSAIEVHMTASRSGISPEGCEDVPLIWVECTGTGTLSPP
jgi:hypothetical protein